MYIGRRLQSDQVIIYINLSHQFTGVFSVNTKHFYNIYTTSAQSCISVIEMFCVYWVSGLCVLVLLFLDMYALLNDFATKVNASTDKQRLEKHHCQHFKSQIQNIDEV